MRIGHLVPAEPGWKAVFKEPDGGESQSRILAWAVSDDDDGGGADDGMFGVIVDPAAPSRIVRAADAVPPSGATFNRYRYVAPEPLVVPPPPAPAPDDTAERLAKGLLKRKR